VVVWTCLLFFLRHLQGETWRILKSNVFPCSSVWNRQKLLLRLCGCWGKMLNEAKWRKRPEGQRIKTVGCCTMTMHLPTHCSPVNFYAVVPQPPYSRFGPCRLSFVPKVWKSTMKGISALEKKLVVVYRQWKGVLWRRQKTNKQTPWPLVCEQTIPTDRPPLVDEI
jgi:hypothetical protein